MKPEICPYVGSRVDPKMALDFPSEGNYCYHARPVSVIKKEHQSGYCLTAKHAECPVFTTRQVKPLPAAIAASSKQNFRARRVLLFALLPLVLLTMVLIGKWLEQSAVASTWMIFPTPSSGYPIQGAVPNTGVLTTNSTRITNTPFQPAASGVFELTPVPVLAANCPLPVGWSPYWVKPNDSLFRLSVVYGTTIRVMQEANCMDNQTTIEPGDLLYIPVPPTSTPTITPTITPTVFFDPPRPVIVPTQPPQNNNPQPTIVPNTQPPPTEASPATSVPATEVVPTIVPPTIVPEDTLPPPIATPTIAPAYVSWVPYLGID